MAANMVKRVAFAALAIPAAIGIIWVGGWPLAGALSALGVLGTAEVYGLGRRAGIEALSPIGLLGAAAIPLSVHGMRHASLPGSGAALYGAALWLLAVLVAAMRRGPGARPLAAVGVTVFGALYAAGLPAFLLVLRHPAGGPRDAVARTALVLFPLALTWLCDTAAMATGSAVGGAKLAPVLSPNKTWAGAAGGALTALGAAAALGLLVLNRLGWDLSLPQLLGIGLAVGTLGQLGDIAESLLKREVGVKDSSTLIPGHGGVLDRLDSLYFAIPVAAALLKAYGLA